MRRSSALQLLLRRSHRFRAPSLAVAGLALAAGPLPGQVGVASPDGRNKVTVEVQDGHLTYSLARDGRTLILPSMLGFDFRGAPRLRDSLRITDTTRDSHDEWWTQPWGEVARVRDHHNELARHRRGNDGAAAGGSPSSARLRRRHRLPVRGPRAARARRLRDHRRAHRVHPRRQRARLVDPVELRRGRTAPRCCTRRSRERARQRADAAHDGDARTAHVHGDPRGEPRGLRAHVPRGPRMESRTLHAALAPLADGVKVRGHTPFVTPWRTIQLADRADGPRALAARPQPQSAERARRAPTGSSR